MRRVQATDNNIVADARRVRQRPWLRPLESREKRLSSAPAPDASGPITAGSDTGDLELTSLAWR